MLSKPYMFFIFSVGHSGGRNFTLANYAAIQFTQKPQKRPQND